MLSGFGLFFEEGGEIFFAVTIVIAGRKADLD
jgi:hypothetical protein